MKKAGSSFISHPGRPSSRRRENTALAWLGNDTRAAGVLATARLHIQVQQIVAGVLPPAVGAVCRVAKLESQRLQLAVPSAAHAARLRQMAPRIAQALAAAGWNIGEIAVKVHAGMPSGSKPPRPPKEAMPLGDTALAAFDALHDTLRPGPLADAVARLLKHHRES
jgi:hypothetical protein